MTAAQRLEGLTLELLELDVADQLLTVTVNRPSVLNALSPQVIAELRQVFGLLRDSIGSEIKDREPDWSIRGVVLTGAGEKSFIAGADISSMREMTPAEAREYAGGTIELTTWMETLPIPVIAAVNGFALGGGCELAMSCDYIFASANASFGQPEVALGLIPGFGGTVRLAQYVGVAAARELILTGRRIGSDEAHRLGLVNRVLPDIDALRAAVRESLQLIAAQSPTAVARSKRTIRTARSLSTDDGLTVEHEAFAACFGTPDMVEGTTAFVEKRPPEFPGL